MITALPLALREVFGETVPAKRSTMPRAAHERGCFVGDSFTCHVLTLWLNPAWGPSGGKKGGKTLTQRSDSRKNGFTFVTRFLVARCNDRLRNEREGLSSFQHRIPKALLGNKSRLP